MKTKNYFFLSIAFCIFLFNTTAVKAQWMVQTSGTSNTLRCVKFVDLNTGWAVGNKGTIIKTINGGNSWTAQTSNTTTDLYSLSFPTPTIGYVSGGLFVFLKTTNGGSTWSTIWYNGLSNKIKSLYFIDSNSGIGVGENMIFRTADGLNNIKWGGGDVYGNQNCVFYINSNIGYTVGDGGTIIKLTGIINDYTSQMSGTTQNLNGVYFVNTSIGYAVGNNGNILKTINGGTLWSTQNSNVVVNLNSVWFTDSNTGYVVGDNETILKTTDGGTTWTTQLTGGSNKLLSVYFKDASNGWIVGENGEILHTTNGGTAIVGIASTPIGSTSRCVGSNVYTTTAVNALSYIWTISPTNSGTIVNSGNSATITWNNNYYGNITITSQGVNGSNLGAVSNSLIIYGLPSTFSLLAPANGIWKSATPLFQWAASTNTSTYNLYIDGILKKSNITTTSYQILSSEAIGSEMHTWYVEASNGCTTQSNETWSFKVDATQPTAFSLVSPADNSWTVNTQPTLTWGASTDVNSGLAKYQLWVDGVLNRDNISNSATSTTPSNILSNGSHTWEIRAVDNVGNVTNSTQIWTVKVDNMPPGLNNSNSYYLQFNGSTNYIVIPNSSSLNITNQKLTIEAWVKISAYKDWASVATKGLNNPDYALRQHGSKINFSSQDYSGYDGNTIIPLNTWTHIAVTYDGTNISFYFNGIYDGGAVVSNYIHNYSESLYLGVDFPTIDEYWNGSLDEIRIWNYAKTQTEIMNNKDIPLSGFESNLAGYWRFNEGSGSVAFDMTSNHNNGTINGASFQISPLSASSMLCNLKFPTNNQFITSSTPSFSWGSTQDSGIGFQKFQLFVDGNMLKDNLSDSTWTVTSSLAYGIHTWFVKGFDLLGNNQTSYSRTFYIDNVKPNAFNLTSPTNNQIVNLPTPNFTWQATTDSIGGSGMRKYQLLINGVVNRDSIPITQTTVAPKNALAQGVYTWSITAYDNVGNVRQSTQTNTFYVDWENPTDFTLITPLDNSTLANAKPEFKWHKSTDVGSGIGKYELNITGQTPITILPTDTSKLITSNLPNGTYTWFVKAYDKAGGITNSNTQTFAVDIDNGRPNAFNLISPTNNQVVNLPTPNLTWQATVDSTGGSGLRKYQLLINGVVNRDSIPITQTTVAPKNALAQGAYTWSINAYDNVGNVRQSTQTNTFYVDWENPTAFTLITPLDNSTLTVAKPQFKWHKSTDVGSGISKYELNITGQTPITILPTDTSKLITSNLPNGLYTWYVKAYDKAGGITNSNTQTFAVHIDNGRPNAFNLISPTNNQVVNLSTPNLTWQATVDSTGGSGLRKYQLLINGVVNRDSIPITQTTVAPKNALAQGAYTWSINAYDNVGNVRQSTQTNTFYVDWENPTAFTLITPLDNSTLTVAKPEFKWHKSTDVGSGISKYELNITGQTPITIIASDTSKIITSNLPNGSYNWYVKAFDVAGGFTSSNTQTFTINVISGVEDIKMNNSIKVYPNPVLNELIIESNELNEKTDFEILNLMGQVVYNGNLIKRFIVQTANLSTGIYLIKFNIGKSFEYKRFIKK